MRDPLDDVMSVKDEIADLMQKRMAELSAQREYLIEQISKGRTFGPQLVACDTRISELNLMASELRIHV